VVGEGGDEDRAGEMEGAGMEGGRDGGGDLHPLGWRDGDRDGGRGG